MRRSFSPFSGFLTSSPRIPILTRPRPSFKENIRIPWRCPTLCNSTASSSSTTSFEYRFIDDVENLERYRPGGYHPIIVGDVLADRYQVVHKLGYGTFSAIWLARDKKRATYVAVKVGTADASSREVEILHALGNSSGIDSPGAGMVPIIQDEFEVKGPNGCHGCYVAPPAQSSVAAAKFCDLFTVETARVLVAQLVLAVAHVHARGFAHGDIHLGNALIRLPSSFDELTVKQFYEKFTKPHTEDLVRVDGNPLLPNAPPHATVPVWLGKTAHLIPPAEAHLLLSDFGEAFSPATKRRRSDECHTPLTAIPPEALFDPESPLSFPADIWALACAIWSILGIRSLFDGTLATCDDIASQQVDIFGFSSVPAEWWDRWEARHKYFDAAGQPIEGRSVFPSLESSFEGDIQAMRREDGMAEFGWEETVAILAMLRGMLEFRPEERLTAQAIIGSKWMVNWGLPELKKARKV